MWRFSEDINTARRFNAVARMQPHCPVLYSGKDFNLYRRTLESCSFFSEIMTT
jgi:hypothetical protein